MKSCNFIKTSVGLSQQLHWKSASMDTYFASFMLQPGNRKNDVQEPMIQIGGAQFCLSAFHEAFHAGEDWDIWVVIRTRSSILGMVRVQLRNSLCLLNSKYPVLNIYIIYYRERPICSRWAMKKVQASSTYEHIICIRVIEDICMFLSKNNMHMHDM